MRRMLAGLVVSALLLGAVATLASCGSSPAGTYTIDGLYGELVLDDDGGYRITGTDPADGSQKTVTGTWKVDGDTVTFTDETGQHSSTATVEEDAIIVNGQRFERQ